MKLILQEAFCFLRKSGKYILSKKYADIGEEKMTKET
jgi:hypothetical protein